LALVALAHRFQGLYDQASRTSTRSGARRLVKGNRNLAAIHTFERDSFPGFGDASAAERELRTAIQIAEQTLRPNHPHRSHRERWQATPASASRTIDAGVIRRSVCSAIWIAV